MSSTATATVTSTEDRALELVGPAGNPPRGSLLPRVMRSEWTKLRSVRSTVWSLFATFGTTVGLGAVFSWAYVNQYNQQTLAERLSFDPVSRSLSGLFLAQLAIGVLGVLVISSEYGTGLIRTTFTAVPQRRTVLAAKVAVFGVVSLVVSMLSVFAAFLVGQAILSGKNVGASLGGPSVLRAVVGAGVYLTFIALLGLGLATIVRRTAGAIGALVGLVLVFPLLAQALPSPWNHDIAKYLPSEIGDALFSIQSSPNHVSPGVALVLVAVWLGTTYAIATLLISRRDA
ncbi:MAG: type transport system permease protein [Actinomycetota bacterium]|nr:type transport system permease protein [Actinomycetota bacterium]